MSQENDSAAKKKQNTALGFIRIVSTSWRVAVPLFFTGYFTIRVLCSVLCTTFYAYRAGYQISEKFRS